MYRHLYPRYVQMTADQIRQRMLQNIIDIDSLQNLAAELFNIAPNEVHRNYLSLVRGESLDILNKLEDLYIAHFGLIPDYNLKRFPYFDYRQGLSEGLNDTIDTIRKSRELALELSGQPEYREIYAFYQDSLIRGLQTLNLVAMLYGQTPN